LVVATVTIQVPAAGALVVALLPAPIPADDEDDEDDEEDPDEPPLLELPAEEEEPLLLDD